MTVLSRTGDKSTSHVEHVEAGDNTPTVRVPVLTQIPVVGHIEIGHPTLLDSDIEYFRPLGLTTKPFSYMRSEMI